MDFTHLTDDEVINGVKVTNVPNHLRNKAHGKDTRETMAQLAELVIQFGVNLGLDPDQSLEWARKLQQAVPQSEFDSWVATLLDGGPSIFMNTLSELQDKYPNGAAGVALVRETDPAKIYVWNGTEWENYGNYQGIEIKDGSVTSDKIVDKSITPQKVTFVTGGNKSRNLFNKNQVVTDSRLDSSDKQTPVSSTGYVYTEYIPVTGGSDIYRNKTTSLYMYTSEKIPLTGGLSNGSPAGSYTLASNAAYIRLNVNMVDMDELQVEYSTSGTEYQPYGILPIILNDEVAVTENNLKGIELGAGKQDKLVAGEGISLVGNNISVINEEVQKNYYKVNSAGDITVFLPITDTEYASYHFSRNTDENYMKMNESEVFEKKENAKTENYDSVSNGILTGTNTDNIYAKSVGTVVTKNFIGYAIQIFTFSDNRGGVWNVKVDGVDYGNFSTWSSEIVDFKQLTKVENLEDTNHTLVMTFMGADPLNPPSDGLARDWLKQISD